MTELAAPLVSTGPTSDGAAILTCSDCGGKRSKRSTTGRCGACSIAHRKAIAAAKPKRQCKECGKVLGRGKKVNLSLCFACCRKSPEWHARRNAGIKASFAQPAMKQKMRAVMRKNHQKALQDPKFRAWLVEHGRKQGRLLQSPEMRPRWDNPEVRAKMAASISEKKMGWCPKEYRAEYKRLIKSKRLKGEEARRIILEQVAQDKAAEKARPKSFEEKLAAVMAGKAQIHAALPNANDDHDFTLAGVSTGW